MDSLMKDKYCLDCGHRLKAGDVCPHCGADNSEERVSGMEIHDFKRHCYTEMNRCRERKNQALSFYVIAAILLVLGLVFFLLSFRYNVLRQRVFTPLSAEFVFCCLTLAGFAVFLVLACIKMIPAVRRMRYFRTLLRNRK